MSYRPEIGDTWICRVPCARLPDKPEDRKRLMACYRDVAQFEVSEAKKAFERDGNVNVEIESVEWVDRPVFHGFETIGCVVSLRLSIVA